MSDRPDEATIIEREDHLRAWFTRGADPILEIIDGLDIGWGGVQRWATGRMPPPTVGPHLDFACGYGTFLAQLGWRFPEAHLVGLNIDYQGPHALIRDLLDQGGVDAELVQADARRMPFADGAFASASCFLGLQDIEIGFGQAGVRTTLAEAARVLHLGGVLTLLDEFPCDQFDRLLEGLPLLVVKHDEHPLDVRWGRQVAERASTLYAEGWVAQARVDDLAAQQQVYREAHAHMREQMEEQLQEKGYYVPFEPIRLVIAREIG
ncbi:MAG: class I SAM-dependent methyltransferase [Anaerolineae bacterium]